MDVANSHLVSVAYNGPMASQLRGAEGVYAEMNDWSGGVLDTATDSLIVWGGGHGGYFGNEVYAFNLKTLTWSMLDTPSSIAGWNQSSPILPDGTPSAQHTYDALTFLPGTGQMFVAGSSGATPNGYSYTQSWLYDPTTGTWHQAASYNGSVVGDVTAYDPVTQKVFAINSASGLESYDPTSNTWKVIGTTPINDYHQTGAIDPNTHMMLTTGEGYLQEVDLTTGAVTQLHSTGDQTVQSGNAPGFVWDDAAGVFVGWNGGSTLYTLDPTTWHWTTYNAASDSTVMPTAANSQGTFGRFQYDAADNVFVVVNAADQDIYILKPSFGPSATAGSGGVAPQMVDQGSGHEMFVFNNLNQAGSTIENFDPTHDTLSLTALLKAANVGGADPTANGTVTFDASGTDSTAITLHTNGHNTTLVTLDHVLPTAVPHTDIIWQ
jgi:hypothetical protein